MTRAAVTGLAAVLGALAAVAPALAAYRPQLLVQPQGRTWPQGTPLLLARR